jgi:hypothetical protein
MKGIRMSLRRLAVPLVMISYMLTFSSEAQLVRSASGPLAANIQATVDLFRSDLGALNANVVGSFGTGRREINWDGVPNASAAPNALPADLFNTLSPRGVVFNTPGTGFQVSANAGIAPIEFGNIDANYPDLFATFSAQRLFTAIGSNIVDVNFFVPGSTDPAASRGFGAVFTDVDLANISSIEFFNVNGVSLGTFFVPNIAGNETLSFLGVSYAAPIISRVRITSGNQILAPGNTATDLVVMDDFIFGEPNRVPEPACLGVLILGGLTLVTRRVRGKRLVVG